MRLVLVQDPKPRRMAGLFYGRLRDFALGLLFLACLGPAITLLLYSNIALNAGERVTVMGASALSLLVLYALLERFPRAALLLLAGASAIALLEIRFITDYGWPINANSLSLIAETNTAEARDLLGSLPSGLIAGWAAVALLTLAAWPGAPPAMPVRRRGRILAYSLAGSAALTVLAFVSTPAADAEGDDAIFPAQIYGQGLALRGAFPAGLPFVVTDYFRERHALKVAYERNQRFRFGATGAKSDHPRVFVLVIGETSRADRWGLNGYARDTTPRLGARHDLIAFRHMLSPWSYSRQAVPTIVSRKPPSNTSAVFDEASIVTAFKEAGFHTTWISLQAPVGFFESPISIHAYEADRVLFLNPVDYTSHGKPDTAAIPELEKILRAPQDRDRFVVIHTLGSHFQYSNRYPAEFARYLPDRPRDRPARLFDPGDREVLSNAYDNSIAFTDHFLNQAIQSLERHPDVESWLFYSSDHGEALFDDCRQYSGHGQSSRQSHSVASLFWASPLYAAGHPQHLQNLRGYRERLVSTAMLFETLTDLGGLAVPGRRQNNSLAAENLRKAEEVVTVFDDSGWKCPTPQAP